METFFLMTTFTGEKKMSVLKEKKNVMFMRENMFFNSLIIKVSRKKFPMVHDLGIFLFTENFITHLLLYTLYTFPFKIMFKKKFQLKHDFSSCSSM